MGTKKHPGTRILVVDDEPAMREVLELRLAGWGFEVRTAPDGAQAKEAAESFQPDIVISDVVMPRMTGMELLESLRAGDPDRPVILVTAQATVDLAVEAMKRGARDFITKPIDYPKLRAILARAEEEVAERRESRRLEAELERGAGFGDFVGGGRAMREVYALIETVASSDAGVIISGESGTGKELAARTIHRLSKRAEGPFVAVNSSAIPENLMESEMFGHERGAFTGAASMHAGCFERAHRGTLLLDEIAEMPLALQPKLLRVLEDQKVRRVGGGAEFSVDVRVLAATNREPREAVAGGKLREDLFYRLNVFTITLPPLRERREDIALLAQAFITRFNRKHNARVEACKGETLELLRAYAWPGNVRELKNTMERAVILARGPWIEPSHLPPYLLGPAGRTPGLAPAPGITAAEAEKELILGTLRLTGNNKAEAARRLGLDVKTIRNKLKAYGIK
ncbi:MAG: sigma-54-dependent Fis family transcriptional regulator [Acidobacteria bacterium]|jgi:DNA-binding NtrC family response regulator|nr:sigma-54-dependent Fis family transcriptional regulator [Acidobacteriota bacterium]